MRGLRIAILTLAGICSLLLASSPSRSFPEETFTIRADEITLTCASSPEELQRGIIKAVDVVMVNVTAHDDGVMTLSFSRGNSSSMEIRAAYYSFDGELIPGERAVLRSVSIAAYLWSMEDLDFHRLLASPSTQSLGASLRVAQSSTKFDGLVSTPLRYEGVLHQPLGPRALTLLATIVARLN